MTSLSKAELIVQIPLVVALLILAIFAYRSKRTLPLLLLMVAAIWYFLLHVVPLVIVLFVWIRGWKTAGIASAKSSLPWLNQTFSFLFLSFMIASLVFSIRERKEIVTPDA